MAPPVSIQQHIIVPAGTQTSVCNLGSIQQSQPLYLASYNNNNATAIQAIYQQGHIRDVPNNLIVKSIQRADGPIMSVIQKIPVTEAMIHQANPNATIASQE
jgi:hypothetical protein